MPPWGSRAATLCSSEDVSSQTDGTLKESHTKTRKKHFLTFLKRLPKLNTHSCIIISCCLHLLRILSALSISSSKVVFTDRLCGERSLSATWPVIFRSVGKHSHESPNSVHMLLCVVTRCACIFHGRRGKCLRFTQTAYGTGYSQGNPAGKGRRRGANWDSLPRSLTWAVTLQLVVVVTEASWRTTPAA